MTESPIVSVIISFFNEEAFLAEAIESVIHQDHHDWELILVDDGSTDKSSDIANSFAAKYPGRIFYNNHENHQNKGLSASRNAGIRLAKGKYVCFLDGDDIWLCGFLSNMVNLIGKHEVAMVCESTEYWYRWKNPTSQNQLIHVGAEADKIYFPPALSIQLYPLGQGSSPCMHALIIKREILVKYAGFDESFTGMYEDIVFLSKIFLHEPVYVSSACNNFYRQRDNSMLSSTLNNGKYVSFRKKFLIWYEKYLSANSVNHEQISTLLQHAFQSIRVRPKLINSLKYLRNKLKKRALVLCYHRVDNFSFDPCQLSINLKNFEEHLSFLKASGLVISSNELIQQLENKKLERDCIVLSFDDGYVSQYTNAKPLLEQFKLPASFFIATETLGKKKEFWWDELAYILFEVERLPQYFQIEFPDEHFHFDLATESDLTPGSSWRGKKDLLYFNTNDRKNRGLLFLALCKRIEPLTTANREQVMQYIRTWSDSRVVVRESYYTMNEDQLKEISNSALFTVGAHTHHHSDLSQQSSKDQLEEIVTNKNQLEKLLGQKAQLFSYPFGRYNASTIEILKALNFKAAFSINYKYNLSGTDLFQINRLMAINHGGKQLESMLKKYFTRHQESV